MLEINEGDAVTIKQIENSIINRAWDEGWVAPAAAARIRRPAARVAVVGSGPAGLAAAQQLRRAGHGVDVFERDEAAGGLVRFGVPDFKIEKSRRPAAHRAARRRGRRAPLRRRRRRRRRPRRSCASSFDAVVLATGSRVPRDLPVPGRELPGVHFAMEYLYARNRWVAARVGPAPARPRAAGQPRSRPRASTSS